MTTPNTASPTFSTLTSTPWDHLSFPTTPIPPSTQIKTIHSILLTHITNLLSARLNTPTPHIPSSIPTQLHNYITEISSQYRTHPYHNFQHAFHSFLSAHKLLTTLQQSLNTTHGIKSDPMLPLALLFSTLIHDVDHPGVSNRQLILEEDELAIFYNDQSVAEQRSLALAFRMLLRNEYDDLRRLLCENEEDYAQFRRIVIDLVLCTDLESPERIQIVKSKWKEAFGETLENRLNKEVVARKSSMASGGKEKVVQEERIEEKEDEESGKVGKNDVVEQPKLGRAATVGAVGAGEEERQQPETKEKEWSGQDLLQGQGGTRPLLAAFFQGRQSMGHISSQLLEEAKEEAGEDDDDEDDEDYSEEEWISLSPSVSSLGDEFDHQKEIDDLDDFNDGNKQAPLFVVGKGEVIGASSAPIAQATDREVFRDHHIQGILNTKELPPSDAKARRCRSLDNITLHQQPPNTQRQHDQPPHENENDNPTEERTSTLQRQNSMGSQCSDFSQQSNNGKQRTKKKQRAPRRFSAPMVPHSVLKQKKTFQSRLGIRRALDFTGSSIEVFPKAKKGSVGKFGLHKNTSFHSADSAIADAMEDDVFDALKASAVLELIIRVADVAPPMQSWETYKRWQSRLFFEQMAAFEDGRGVDPCPMWFENQLTFMDSYVMPLARRMGDCKVFGEDDTYFVDLVEKNRRMWLKEGHGTVTNMIMEWEEKVEEQG